MPDEITIQARAFSDLIQDDQPRIDPPQLPGLTPHTAAYWWRQIAYAFPIRDPRLFPPIGRSEFSAEHLEILDRYQEAVQELGASEVLNGEHRITIGLDKDDGESVQAAFPRAENLRGFSVLFRQFYSDGETASFDHVRKALGETAAKVDDASHDQRLDDLKHWKKAHARMHGAQLEMLVLEQIVKHERVPPSALELHRQNPAYLISLYNYGDLIHFGRKRETLKKVISGGPVEENWTKMEFLISVAAICHLYVGFGVLIEAALGEVP